MDIALFMKLSSSGHYYSPLGHYINITSKTEIREITLERKTDDLVLHYNSINEATPIDRSTSTSRLRTRQKQQSRITGKIC